MPSVGVQAPRDHDRFDARLTRWFDHRLAETTPSGASVQLYGLEVIDPDGIDELDPVSVRTVFVCEGGDVRAVLDHPDAWRATEFDAAALVRRGQKTATSSITMTTSMEAGRPSVSLPAPSKICANGTCDWRTPPTFMPFTTPSTPG